MTGRLGSPRYVIDYAALISLKYVFSGPREKVKGQRLNQPEVYPPGGLTGAEGNQ